MHSTRISLTSGACARARVRGVGLQFGRASNFFFLFMAVVGLIPAAAIISPVLAIMPLAIVLTVSAIKEVYEDTRRVRRRPRPFPSTVATERA
jgi:hypothetical protein